MPTVLSARTRRMSRRVTMLLAALAIVAVSVVSAREGEAHTGPTWFGRAVRTLMRRAAVANAPSDTTVVFGPKTMALGTSTSGTFVEKFTVPTPTSGGYLLRLTNGPAGATSVTGGTVSLNGAVVVSTADIAALTSGATRDVPVVATAADTLIATLSGPAGSAISISLLAVPDSKFIVYGPRTFERGKGTPVIITETFALPAGAKPPAYLCIRNGELDGSRRNSSSRVILNGIEIIGPSVLNQQVAGFIKPVTFQATNTIQVEMNGTPGSRLTICGMATDSLAPRLTITAPVPGFITRQSTVDAVGIVVEQTAVTITVNGQPASVTPGTAGQTSFTARVPLAAEGPNTLAFRAVDAAGNRTDSTRTVIRDTQAPVVTLNSLPDSATVRADSAVTVSGTITDLTKVTANVNGQPLAIDSVTHAFSQRITLSSGTNFVTVTATDAAGNATSVVRQVTVDNTPPTLTLTGPGEGLVTKELVAHVTGTASANSAVTVKVNGVAVTLGAGGAFTTDVAITEGANTLTVVATNAAGLSATATRHVVRDTQAPALGWAAPADSAITTLSTIDVTGTIADATATTLTVNGAAVAVNATTKAYTTTLPLAADGVASITLVATDAAGNTTTQTRTVTRDATPPQVTVQEPDAGLVTQAATVHVSGSVSDLTKSTLTVNGVALTVAADGGFTGDVALTAGANTLAFVAVDAAGNRTQVDRALVRDNDPPVVTMASPSDQVLVRTTTVTVRGTITDASAVTATLNGVTLTIAADRSYQSTIALSEGVNTITLVATDAAGNATTTLRTVTLDTTPPVLVVSTPADNATTTNAQTTVAGTATDQSAVHVAVNGTAVTLATGGAFTTTTALVVGANTITVVATDSVGNAATVVRTVQRSQAGPALPPDPTTVAPPLDRTVATTVSASTAFLYTGANPIQTGVATGTIQPFQASVVRGKVLQRNGQQLSGVRVSVLNHPELGQTLSRQDGAYDLAVNGGGTLTLVFTKVGLLSAQRQLVVPRQQWVTPDPVALIQLDSVVTVVDLSQPASVARGSVTTDSAGTRRTTTIFEQGTVATMVMPNGTTQPITTLAVRATEYTVGPNGPLAMPGSLPPRSAYTYAAELSVDQAEAAGAVGVTFSKPVAVYVENFVGFPVGGIVPVGSYDRARATWLPEADGRVLKVLSTSGGTATLDVNGSGSAASQAALDSLGVTAAESGQLALLFRPGQTLWHFTTRHFTSFDLNWSPLDKSLRPQQKPPTSGDQDKEGKRSDKQPCNNGSVIGCDRRTLGETIAIAGSPASLVYTSERSAGFRPAYSFDVALSDGVPQAVLDKVALIYLRVQVAGRVVVDSFTPAVNLHAPVQWDGLDVYGRAIQGPALMRIEVGYRYLRDASGPDGGPKYGQPISGGASFGQSSGTALEQRMLVPVVLWQTVLERPVGGWKDAPLLLGGWSLSVRHAYDPTAGILSTGDGEHRSARNLNNTIARGGGVLDPAGLVANEDGSILMADDRTGTPGRQIFRIARDGTKTVFAGNGSSTFSGDGGPASQAGMNPTWIAKGPDGSIYVSDDVANRIRRIDPNGIITTIGGDGSCTEGGDGGPAILAGFCTTDALAVGADGSVYVTGSGGATSRVRRIGPDGVVTHFAIDDSRSCGFTGVMLCQDSVPALATPIGFANKLAVHPDGSVLIWDDQNLVIWKVNPSGLRTRFAGIDDATYRSDGDGGPARLAHFDASATALAVGPDGSVYVALFSGVVRRIDPSGIITTIAGNGHQCGSGPPLVCPNGDGRNALQATLPSPYAITVSPDNIVYIGDNQLKSVFQVSKPLPGFDGNTILIASTDGSELFRFDGAGRHLTTIDAMSGVAVSTFGYDGAGRLVSITSADGNVTSIDRAADGTPLAIVSPYGQRTTLTLGSDGYLSAIRAPGGETDRFTYGATGLLATRTENSGALHRFTYDAVGQLVSDRNADGLTKTLATTPTATGKQVTLTSGASETRSYKVETLPNDAYQRTTTNAAGLSTTTVATAADSTRVAQPDGTVITSVATAESRFGMQAPGGTTVVTLPSALTRTVRVVEATTLATPSDPLSLVQQTDSLIDNGIVSTSVYNAAARSLTSLSSMGRTSSTTLDSLGRLARTSSGGLSTTLLRYDARGRVQQVVDAGRATTVSYDAAGRPATITDPLGRVVRFVNDSVGRPLSVQDAAGTIAFSYDSAGSLRTVTPAGRPAHRFTYTLGGLPLTYDAPSVPGVGSTTTRFRYDADLRMRSIVRASGDSVTMSYDAAGRPASITHADGTTSFSYGATTGLLNTVRSSTGGSYAMTYDGSLLTSATLSGGPVTGSITYGYDNFLRPRSIAVNGNAITRAYDTDGLLLSAGALTIARSVSTGLAASAAVDGVATAYTYDSTGVVTGATSTANGTPLYAYQLERDVLDRIVRKVETISGTTTDTRFAYDSAGRLRSVTRDGVASAAYEYDANGNRTSRTSSAGIELGVVDAQDRLTSYGGATYQYTDAGELTRQIVGPDTTTYHYDAMGALRWVQQPNGTRIDYVIDAAGRRVGRTVNGVLTQGFLYESELRIAAELAPSGAVLSRFVYGTQVNVPEYMERGGTRYRLLTDHLGSVRLVVDATSGVVQQRLDYDEYGRVTANTNPGFQPFGYAGGLLDDATGLVRFGRRDYAPLRGRFASKDPSGLRAGEANLYAYVGSDPVNLNDPTGKCPWCIAAGIGGLEAAGIDLLIQLARNGWDVNCITWGSVAEAGLSGAFLSGLMPTGWFLGRGGPKALAEGYNELPGLLNGRFVKAGGWRVGWGVKKVGEKAYDLLRMGRGRAKTDINWSMIEAEANAWRDGSVSGGLAGAFTGGGKCDCGK